MSSILKVDQLQDSGGNAIITSNGSGTITVNSQPFKNGITEVDQWRLTADLGSNIDPISSNLERVDTDGGGYLGTGMSVSSGTFTFPSTGLWRVSAFMFVQAIPNDNVGIYITTTTNNSTYSASALMFSSGDGGSLGDGSGHCEFNFNVTDTTTHKVRFRALSISSGSLIKGSSSANETCFTFIRLGDSV